MQKIVCDLDEIDIAKFDYCYFAYMAIQNLVNNFITSDTFEYNQEHYNIIIETYVESYTNLQKIIIEILEKNKYMNIPLRNYEYIRSQNQIIINS